MTSDKRRPRSGKPRCRFHDVSLGATDIGNERVTSEMLGDLRQQTNVLLDRGRKHHQVSACEVGDPVCGAVDRAAPRRVRQDGRAVNGGDADRGPALTDRQRDRPANQAETNDRYVLKRRFFSSGWWHLSTPNYQFPTSKPPGRFWELGVGPWELSSATSPSRGGPSARGRCCDRWPAR